MKVPTWAKQCSGAGTSRTSGPGTAIRVGGHVGNSIAKAAIGEGLTLGKRTCCGTDIFGITYDVPKNRDQFLSMQPGINLAGFCLYKRTDHSAFFQLAVDVMTSLGGRGQ
eukprot:4129688-Ditylum_brightwellii.AAC.1